MIRALAITSLAILALVPWPGASAQGAAAGVLCYAVANYGGGYGGDDLLTAVDPDNVAGQAAIGPGTGTFDIASLSLRGDTGGLYAIDGDRLGTLDIDTGLFRLSSKPLASGEGSLGRQTFADAQGLAFEPASGNLFAVVRRIGPDLLIRVNPETGAAVKKAFADGSADYLPLQGIAGLEDVVDIAFNPADGTLFGIATDAAGTSHLVRIDPVTGAMADVGPAGMDIQGLGFASDGRLLGTVGGASGALVDVDLATGLASNPRPLAIGAGYRGLACLPIPPNIVTGKVFGDTNTNGVWNDGEPGTPGVTVQLYRDRDEDGVASKKDVLVSERATDADGNYRFTVGAEGAFVAKVNRKTLPRGQKLTTPEVRAIHFVGGGQTSAGNDFGHAKHPRVEDEVVVRFVPGTPQATIDRMLADRGMKVKRYLDGIDAYLCSAPAGQAEALVADLNAQPEVYYAEYNYVVQSTLHPNDPLYNDPTRVYAPQLIGAESAWDRTTGSPGVIVAVLDSGISWTHPEFSGRIALGKNMITGVSDTADVKVTQDDNGHGTHVAGIIGAAINNNEGIVGIAPGITLLPVKVLNGSCVGNTTNVAAGIDYAVASGARVINLSLAFGTDSQAVLDAVDRAAAAGVLSIAAAGNSGGGITFYPAAYDAVFAAGATTAGDARYSLSNYENYLDIAAPGENIWSSYWTSADPDGYASTSGTSMAAPHVAGLAALIFSARPDLTASDVRALIETTATDLGDPGWDAYFGWGRINAAAALADAQGYTAPTPTPTATATGTPAPPPTSTPTPVPYSQRANPGGSSFVDGGSSVWAQDKAYATGSWGYTAGSAKSSTTAVNGTTDDPLYQKYRDSPGEYRYTVTNGTYQVTLRFAEFGVSAANNRVFKITIEGVEVESALDIYKLVGKATALERTYTATVNDGLLNIAFARNGGNSKYNPVVSAVAVIAAGPPPPPTYTPTSTPTVTPGGPTFTPTPTVTPTATPAPYLQRANAGGSTFTDGAGQSWAADKAYATGSWGYTTGTAKSSTTAVNGTTDDLLYQKYRELAGEYRFTVPNGTYQVTLKFAEFSASKAGDRVMKITLEGTVVENALDVWAAAGKATALDRTHTVSVADGLLNIVFAKASGRTSPMVSAIEVKSQ